MSTYDENWMLRISWPQRMFHILRIAARRERRAAGRFRAWPMRWGPYTVTPGVPALGYGRNNSGRGWLTHIPDQVYLVWRDGKMLDSGVRWRCGSVTRFFRFLEEPESTLCITCTIDRPQRPPHERISP